MPTYEYVCDKCGHQFEQVQSISAKALTICPEDSCGRKRWGKGKVRRAISAGGGLLFKGTGFYITDYRSDSYKKAAKNDTASSVSKPATTSGDSKPAAKPDSKPAKPTPSKV
jgi:putative FmdB family regulatory protein